MEVLFISHKYPPATGGMEKFSYELIHGIKIHAKVHTIIYEGNESKIAWFYKLKNRVNHTIKSNPGITIVHLNDGLMTYFALWIKKKHNVKVVATLHGLDIVFPLPYFQKKIIPRFNCIDGFACVSEATKLAAIHRGIMPSKIIVIDNGVDHGISQVQDDFALQDSLKAKFGLTVEQQIVLSIGRSVKRKGFSWFVTQVLPLLNKNVVFILCGPNSSYDGQKWKRFIPEKWVNYLELMLGLPSDESTLQKYSIKSESRFIKTGFLPYNEIIQLLKMATVFVMPNIKIEGDMEGFGLVALEASMSNTIVCAANIDGITNAIIHHKNGILIESENVKKWADSIQELLNRTDLGSLSENYKLYTINNYSWQKMCKEYFDWFAAIN